MTLTLLLDLDDTLLENNMDTFLPAYLKGLAGRLAPFVEPDRMVKALLAATGQMVKNTSPARTLEETFDAAFYPALGLEKETVRPALDAYYAEDFPHLQKLTRPHPQTSALVEKALRAGYRVGIATNPLFPRIAIEQRIAWAGLGDAPFALIPAYETFHFAKPNPAFVSEFLGHMGWPDGPVLMVGDDLENDYAAARGAGIAMYWVPKAGKPIPPGGPDLRGDLGDLLDFLDASTWETLWPDFSAPSACLASLRATPATLSTMMRGITPQTWAKRPTPTSWNLTEIACHLRDAENEVNLARIQKILHDDAPFLAGMDTDAWATERRYAEQDGPAALQAFVTARIETLSLLTPLPMEAWQRPARHAIFGPTTLQELAGVIDRHDHIHLRQANEIICPLP
jgi:HAD superfamily hydrolase (TIGR01549 family)